MLGVVIAAAERGRADLLPSALAALLDEARARGLGPADLSRVLLRWEALAAVVPAGARRWVAAVPPAARPALDAPTAEPEPPLSAAAATWLHAALTGQEELAVLLARGAGDDVPTVVERLLRPALEAAGRARLADAVEHRLVALAMQVLAATEEPAEPPERPRGFALVGGAPGDPHALGAWSLATRLEADGWEVAWLGADPAPGDLIFTVEQTRPDLLALSLTLASGLPRVAGLLRALRERPAGAEARVLVGGPLLERRPELGALLPADACPRDAAEALRLAREAAP